MNSIGRNPLPHDQPPNVEPNPEGDVYFITICCLPRGTNQLANALAWQAVDETLAIRESKGDLNEPRARRTDS
jgi:hypothetical protein